MPSTNNSQHNRNKVSINPAISLSAFIILTCALIAPGLLSPDPQKAISFIALFVDIIIFFILATYLTDSKKTILRKKTLFKIILMIFTFVASLAITAQWDSLIEGISAFVNFLNEYNPLVISTIITLTLGFLLFLAKAAIFRTQKWISGSTNNYFIFTLAGLAILGASSALLIPSYTNLFRSSSYISTQQDTTKENTEKAQENPTSTPSSAGDKAREVEQKSTSDLRLHLLYITGGVIATLGLIETNRKNSQDHIRQVHAARRERYIEAVDKLASEQAPVRLGGVYALVGLVDEWLDDDNIDEKTQIKEGQIIINNLCSYIRSSFPLALKAKLFENDIEPSNYGDGLNGKGYAADQAAFREEQDVRRAIFIEMSKRCSTINDAEGIVTIIPGAWSEFEFDFTGAPVFYPLNNLRIEKGNFSFSKFYSDANFAGSTFIDEATFFKTVFTQKAIFIASTFIEKADFDDARFKSDAAFSSTVFYKEVIFNLATFHSDTFFNGTVFALKADFCDACFERYEPTFVFMQSVAQFSAHANPLDFNFAVDTTGMPVHTGKTKFLIGSEEILNKPFILPIESVLYDPAFPMDKHRKYPVLSPPAQ